MATIQGTPQGVQLLHSTPSGAQGSGITAFQIRKGFLVTLSFATGVTNDVGSISGLDTTIKNREKNGRSFTITHAAPAFPGFDSSGNAVYITGTVTAGVTGGEIDFSLGGVTASGSVNPSNGVGLFVEGYES